MAIQGLRVSTNFATDERPKNWREGVLLLYPNGKTPLYGLTAAMKKRTVDSAEFNWWDKQLDDRRMQHSGAHTSNQTNITLATGDGQGALTLKDGDILMSEQTSELMLVNGDPASDTALTVVRGYAGTTKTALATTSGHNPNLLKVGNAYEEASDAPTGINFNPVKRYNYTQIFRNTFEMSRTGSLEKLRTKEQVAEARRETLEMHSMDIERAFWHGTRFEGTRNGKPIRTMGGIFNTIDSGNVKTVTADYPSGLTFAGLEEYMYNIFKFGSSQKMGFCGNRALLTIQQVCRKGTGVSWNVQMTDKEFGMNITRLTSPFGEIALKTHPMWNQVTGGTTGTASYYALESWLCVLDMENVKSVTLKESDTKYQPNIQDNGLDGMKSGYLTECSLELHHPITHYLLKNLVASAAG